MRFSIISLLIVSEVVLGFVTKSKHEDNNLNSKSEPNEQTTSLKRRTFNINLGSLLDIFTGGSKQNPPPNTGGQNIGGPQNYYPPNYYNNPYQWPYRQPYQPPYYPPYWPRPDPNPRPSPTKPIPSPSPSPNPSPLPSPSPNPSPNPSPLPSPSPNPSPNPSPLPSPSPNPDPKAPTNDNNTDINTSESSPVYNWPSE